MAGLKNVRHRRNDGLSRIGWERFEALLATYYRDLGYAVDHCGTGATARRFDGGIDLKLRKDNQYILVQCKHWNAKQVPHNDVHQLLGLMVNESATGAILVTSGEFTTAARAAAEKLGHVQLVDGDSLRQMLGPVTEPDTPASGVFDTISLSAPRLIRDVGDRIGSQVSDRLLRAAEDRIRQEGRGAANTAARGLVTFVVLKVLAAALLLLMAWFAFRTILTVIEGLARSPAPVTTAQPSAPAPPGRYGMPAAAPAASSSDACRETIDARSGTYIDHCLHSEPRQPSAAERREQQRRADEAIKVLEDSTPEM